MNAQQNDPINEIVFDFKFTGKRINEILTMLNQPMLTTVSGWSQLINEIHAQARPQIPELDPATNPDGVPVILEERN
jgi:hypothetical protein